MALWLASAPILLHWLSHFFYICHRLLATWSWQSAHMQQPMPSMHAPHESYSDDGSTQDRHEECSDMCCSYPIQDTKAVIGKVQADACKSQQPDADVDATSTQGKSALSCFAASQHRTPRNLIVCCRLYSQG
eukprot:GHUV01018750.1.p1 GENE.GHUV01018750.1~~GHUV01018750.1.p1  ORF type:complete len:132 (-),score=28.81 GHUV01018750.1:1532-1927(-)